MNAEPATSRAESKLARFTFHSLPAYQKIPKSYRLLPFRVMRFDDASYFLVNECGEYAFLDPPTFRAFAKHELGPHVPVYADLKAKQFLMDDASSPLLDILATKYRTKKSFLRGF